MSSAPAGTSVRLAELVATLSLGTDLGMGQPMEHVLRQSLIAVRLAERLGLDESEREVVYYVGLLAWVGCHVDAYEQAKWFGDDTAFKGDSRRVDMGRPLPTAAFVLTHLGANRRLLERMRLGIAFLGDGRRAVEDMIGNHWVATNEFAERLGLGREVRESLYQTFERWDGKGVPAQAKGSEIRIAARLVNLADVVEVFERAGGAEAAITVARERSGTQFDPALVEVFCAEVPTVFKDLETVTSWPAVIAAEPALAVVLSEEGLDAALEAIADFVDLKSPWTIGHSRGVADLAGEAAQTYGLSAPRRRPRAPGRPPARHWSAGCLQCDLGQAGAAHRRRAGKSTPPPLPDRTHAGVLRGAGALGGDRRAAP